jgi:hypothetical protein
MQRQAIEPADRPGPEGVNDTSRPISHVLSLHPFWKMVGNGLASPTGGDWRAGVASVGPSSPSTSH